MTAGISGIGASGISMPTVASLQSADATDSSTSTAGVGAGDGAGAATSASGGSSFADLLSNKVSSINTEQNQASGLMEDLATGKSGDVAQTMMRIQEANLDLKMATQVRDKMVDAYQQVMQMQM